MLMDKSEQIRLLLELRASKGWEVLSAYLREQALELNNRVLGQLINKNAKDVEEAIINAQRIAVYHEVMKLDEIIKQLQQVEVAQDIQQ